MKQEMNYSEYVDRYLDNVMSKEERVWFEKELEGNLKLQNEVKLQKNLQTAITDSETMALKEQLNLIHDQVYKPWTVKVSKYSMKKATVIVSGLAVAFALVAMLLISQKNKPSSADLYAQYFKPAEIGMSFRTSGNAVSNELRTAMMLYESKRFDEAIVLFEQILEKDNSRIGLNLYSGISHLEVNQYDEANLRFKRIIDHKSNAFIESAEWYLGLCYLLKEDEETAVEVFQKIVDKKGYYARDAKKILNKLK
ncbi:MAG: tetratricopeptide repeat protein [Bacteroidales bacterium]|nr:tetratricopeptide repeat protein [Bacteroidales bacterium]